MRRLEQHVLNSHLSRGDGSAFFVGSFLGLVWRVVGSFYTTFRLSSAPKYKILQALLAISYIVSALAIFDMLSALLTLQRLFYILERLQLFWLCIPPQPHPFTETYRFV